MSDVGAYYLNQPPTALSDAFPDAFRQGFTGAIEAMDKAGHILPKKSWKPGESLESYTKKKGWNAAVQLSEF